LFFEMMCECSLLVIALAMTGRTDIMPPTNPIERSFELAAERCEDLTPAGLSPAVQ